MKMKLRALGIICLLVCGGWWIATSATQEKPAEKSPDKTKDAPQEKSKDAGGETAQAAGKKNPVKATPEVLAEGKKIFGYDCAMCHGESGDGRGELVDSMKLTMKNWRENTVVDEMTDEAIYDLIVKGKDKMIGEGDRLAPAKVWGLVHYVRTISKKKSS